MTEQSGTGGGSPAELVRQLREWAGSHDKLAARLRSPELASAGMNPTRTTIIRWERGEGPSRRAYAERLSEVSQESPQPRPPEAFLAAPQQPGTAELEALVARLEQVAESLQLLRAQASEEIVTQLERQTALLATLERAAASLPAAQPAPPSRRAGKRTA